MNSSKSIGTADRRRQRPASNDFGQRLAPELGEQDIADVRLAADRRALRHQVGDVVLDGAFRHRQVLRQPGRSNRMAAAARGLEEV